MDPWLIIWLVSCAKVHRLGSADSPRQFPCSPPDWKDKAVFIRHDSQVMGDNKNKRDHSRNPAFSLLDSYTNHPPPVAIFLGRWSFREYGNQNQIPVVLLTPDIPRRYFFLGTGNQECNITWYKNLHSFMAMKKRIIWSVLPKWFYWTWCMVNHRRMVWLGQEFLIWLVSLANVKWGHIIYNYFM